MSEMAYIAMDEGQRAGHRMGKKLMKAWPGRHHEVFLADALDQMAATYCERDADKMRMLANRLSSLAGRLETRAMAKKTA